jgi:hypothetical protein
MKENVLGKRGERPRLPSSAMRGYDVVPSPQSLNPSSAREQSITLGSSTASIHQRPCMMHCYPASDDINIAGKLEQRAPHVDTPGIRRGRKLPNFRIFPPPDSDRA